MRVAYLDCIAGITGDTALAALIDAGVDLDEIRKHLATLPLEPFDLEVERVEERGIGATRVEIRAETPGLIRTYAGVRAVLDGGDLPPDVLQVAQRTFRLLAEAEARVHRRDLESVTFHDTDGLDTIVDVVGTALGLAALGVERVFSSAVPTGLGMTRTEHGALPIPTPTVVELLRGAPLFSRGVAAELTNATGAAILAAIVEGYGEIPTMRVETVGYGAGFQRLDIPNLFRVMVGEEEPVRSRPSFPGAPGLHLVTDTPQAEPVRPEPSG
ncbi:MAG: nickel pincer cofactor biosynthesis protein LarC [Actinomycetota bacterium]